MTTSIEVIGVTIEGYKGRFSLSTTCTEVSDSLTITWESSNNLFFTCQLKRNEVTIFSDCEVFTSCFIAKYVANTTFKNVCSVEVFGLPLFQFNRIINWFTSWDHVYLEHFRVFSFKFSQEFTTVFSLVIFAWWLRVSHIKWMVDDSVRNRTSCTISTSCSYDFFTWQLVNLVWNPVSDRLDTSLVKCFKSIT